MLILKIVCEENFTACSLAVIDFTSSLWYWTTLRRNRFGIGKRVYESFWLSSLAYQTSSKRLKVCCFKSLNMGKCALAKDQGDLKEANLNFDRMQTNIHNNWPISNRLTSTSCEYREFFFIIFPQQFSAAVNCEKK